MEPIHPTRASLGLPHPNHATVISCAQSIGRAEELGNLVCATLAAAAAPVAVRTCVD